ncbi:MAG TPA: SDR family NAD(P)-dependent oxidoreductase [Candidatus Dormibacteraeota bacterium]|jgi:NAD(P)-dependent dehydrogenase (short-subunit alcohol dehydrogenase family)
MELARVRALVTGGTSGLGRATAAAIVAAGGTVAILGRDARRGDDAVRDLGPRAVFTPADIVDPDQVQAALSRAVDAFGEVNVLVNCAGISAAGRVLRRSGPGRLEDFARVVNVNLVGTFNCVRLAAATMARTSELCDGERGVVLNTASIAAFEGQLGQTAYAAAKGGIVAMTLPLARELGELGIRVVTIAPGIFDTPMLHAVPEPVRAELSALTPFPKRFGEAAEYAALVLHVIQNRMLNGETIRLDGALRMT